MTTLAEIPVGKIVLIGIKHFRVTDLEAGLGQMQLEQVVQQGSSWVNAQEVMSVHYDRKDNGIYSTDIVVELIE